MPRRPWPFPISRIEDWHRFSTLPVCHVLLHPIALAALRITSDFEFKFTYKDGSYYRGTVTDDGNHAYFVGEKIVTSAGTYDIYASTLEPGATVGIVKVTKYYNTSTEEFYAPYVLSGGAVFGRQGLQSEYGQIDTPTTLNFGWAVYGGQPVEARPAFDDAFQFSFTYNDGSYYTGEVIDDGQADNGDGYSVGEEFGNAYGYYTITQALGPVTDTSGNVYVDRYHDVATNQDYTPEGHGKGPDGTAGLGSELDTTDGNEGSQPFGQFGAYEARQSPHTNYSFQFQYKDGSSYTGTVVADASSNYHVGSIINTEYGFFIITGSAGATTNDVGEVTLASYSDVTTGTSQQGVAYTSTGDHGLGSEIGYFDGVEFGQGGALEAKIASLTAFNFSFHYNDGSFYYGTVTDDSSHKYYIGERIDTDYGDYTIDSGAPDSEKDDPGTVRLTYYQDRTGTPSGVPTDSVAGTEGLGSEFESIDGEYFGNGGQFEAGSERTLYNFRFTYSDGAFYDGLVAGTSYHVGEVIRGNVGGTYTILDEETTNKQDGAVSVSDYHDSSGKEYTPYRFTQGLTAGTSGLGSELDYIPSAGGYTPFGFGGEYEAHPISNTVSALSRFTDFAVFDGPIAGATVGYLDGAAPPGTLAIDPDQPTATTRADGGYTLSAGVGPLVLTGGTDAYTGLAFHGVLSSAGQSPAISPLTTLVEAVAEAKGDTTLTGIAAANALVVGALGLPAGLDLTTYIPGEVLDDPTATAVGIATAEAVYRAGAALLDAQTLIDAAGGSGWTALEQTARSLADGSVTDLKDLAGLIDRGGLTPDADSAVHIIDAATEAFLDLQLDGMTVPGQILELISGASIARQGDASSALAAAAGDVNKVATDYVKTLAATLLADDRLALEKQTACFVSGTRIATLRGEIPVEELRVGDRVVTLSGVGNPLKPIIWIGRAPFDARRHPRPREVVPVRIRAGALGDDLPHRDLLVSPGHCLLIDGVLMQAERLVNGRTICRDTSMARGEYFHIELARHDILLSEGVPSESYLDTGNRGAFVNGGGCVDLHPDFSPRHWTETCVKLVLEGPELTRARSAVLARAMALGHVLTADPDPCVVADGERIDAVRLGEDRLAFVLPSGCREIRLRSRSFVPAEIEPESHDWRRLGVAVERLQVDGQEVPLGAADAFAVGWHGLEEHCDSKPWRWTTGFANLPAGSRSIVIDVARQGGQYWDAVSSPESPLYPQGRVDTSDEWDCLDAMC